MGAKPAKLASRAKSGLPSTKGKDEPRLASVSSRALVTSDEASTAYGHKQVFCSRCQFEKFARPPAPRVSPITKGWYHLAKLLGVVPKDATMSTHKMSQFSVLGLPVRARVHDYVGGRVGW